MRCFLSHAFFLPTSPELNFISPGSGDAPSFAEPLGDVFLFSIVLDASDGKSFMHPGERNISAGQIALYWNSISVSTNAIAAGKTGDCGWLDDKALLSEPGWISDGESDCNVD
jgi:hypothetical protein